MPACVRSLSREASRSGTALAWLRSDCHPAGKEVTREQLARPGEGTGWQGWHCGGPRSPSREGMRRAFPPPSGVCSEGCGPGRGGAGSPEAVPPRRALSDGWLGGGAPTLEGWSWPWRCWAGVGGEGRAGGGAARRGAGGRRQAVRGPRGHGCGAGAGPHPGPPRSPSRKAHEEGDGHGQAAARQDPEDPPEREAAALAAGPAGSPEAPRPGDAAARLSATTTVIPLTFSGRSVQNPAINIF